MDRRIGYGLTLRQALEKAYDAVTYLGGVDHFSMTTKDHDVVWAESREDGWRVYTPPEDEETKGGR